jgi:hypothetical protein
LLAIILIKLKNYGTWFFANFILCGIPFIVMLLVGYDQIDIFSGFLVFNYTIIISGWYLFLKVINQKKEMPIFLNLISFAWGVMMIVSYCLFPKSFAPCVNTWLKDNFWITYLIIIAITIVISLSLSRPYIESNIKETNVKDSFEVNKREKEKIKKYKDIIERDEI